MQFFPASMSHGAQSFRANGAFEMMDSRPGQDFNDLFSAHLEQPAAAAAPPQTDQPQPTCGHEKPFVEDRDFGQERVESSASDSTVSEGQSTSDDADTVQAHGSETKENGAETAKAAASEQKSSASGQENSSTTHAAKAHEHGPDGQSSGQGSDISDDALAAEVQAVLDGLAEDAEGRSGEQDGVKAKIEALHELLRQFRQSEPAGRSELAVTLGAQIKALKAELAAAAETASSGESARTARNSGQVAAQASSRAAQRIEALAQRLEAYRNQDKGGENLGRGLAEAASALADTSGAVPGDEGGRSRSTRRSVAAVAASQRADSANVAGEGKGASESAAPSVKKSVQGSDSALRSASRGKEASAAGVQTDGPSSVAEDSAGKIRSAVEAADDSLRQGDQRQEPASAEAVQKKAAAKDVEQAGRGESAMARGGLPAAGSRIAMAREGSAQAVVQDAVSQLQDGEPTSGRIRSADSDGSKKQNDARQGFFGTPDREKTSSSTLRAHQLAGNEKAAPESLTQTAAQNSQTQFQQRLDSPVSTRSAQVYQQVENGAFKNLGQGVKQLVIRLDPADLGQVSVILQVRGKEVQAVLRATNQETSLALNEQLGQLRTQLEAQGLKVGKLEVQTQLADSQSQSQWQGSENHNRYQENQELAMSAKRWRTLERVAPDLARDVHNSPQREKLSQRGLDIFA